MDEYSTEMLISGSSGNNLPALSVLCRQHLPKKGTVGRRRWCTRQGWWEGLELRAPWADNYVLPVIHLKRGLWIEIHPTTWAPQLTKGKIVQGKSVQFLGRGSLYLSSVSPSRPWVSYWEDTSIPSAGKIYLFYNLAARLIVSQNCRQMWVTRFQNRPLRYENQKALATPKCLLSTVVVLTDVHKCFETPPSRRWSFIPFLRVRGLNDLLLTNRGWQRKTFNLAVEKSGRCPLNQPNEVKQSSDADGDVTELGLASQMRTVCTDVHLHGCTGLHTQVYREYPDAPATQDSSAPMTHEVELDSQQVQGKCITPMTQQAGRPTALPTALRSYTAPWNQNLLWTEKKCNGVLWNKSLRNLSIILLTHDPSPLQPST